MGNPSNCIRMDGSQVGKLTMSGCLVHSLVFFCRAFNGNQPILRMSLSKLHGMFAFTCPNFYDHIGLLPKRGGHGLKISRVTDFIGLK